MDRNNVAHDNQRDSPLLRLPAELRNKIYYFTFLDSTVNVKYPRSNPPKVPGNFQKDMSLLLTCRQTQSECAGMFYSLATFDMTHIDPRITGRIKLAYADSITAIRISRSNRALHGTSTKDIKEWMQKLPSLHRVYVWGGTAKSFSSQPPHHDAWIRAKFGEFGLEAVIERFYSAALM